MVNEIRLVRFTLSFRANGIRITLNAEKAGNKCLAAITNSREGNKQLEVPPDFMTRLETMINKHNIQAWSGFRESSEHHQLICESFFLDADFEDGSKIYAEGSSSFPGGFFDANREIFKLFGLDI